MKFDVPAALSSAPAGVDFWRALAEGGAWQPRHVGADDDRGLLPFLVWLAQGLRPTCAVQLGMADGTLYFGLCQSLLETAPDAGGRPPRLYGFDSWQEAGGRMPPALRNHNDGHYRAASRLLSADPVTAADFFEPGAVDLLLLHTVPDGGLAALVAQWLPLMSARGVLVLRRDRDETADTASLITTLTDRHPHVTIAETGPGLTMLLVGARPAPALAQLAGWTADSPERVTLARHFAAQTAAAEAAEAARHDRAALEQAQHELVVLTGIAETARLNAETLARDKAALEQAQATTAGELAAVDRALATAEKTIDAIQKDKAALEQAFATLRNESMARQAADADTLATLRSDTVARLAERDTALADMAAAREAVQNDLAQRTAALEQAQHELVILTGIAETTRLNAETLARDKAALEQAKATTATELAAARKAMSALQKDKAVLEQAQAAATAQLAAARKEIEATRDALSGQRQQNAALEQTLKLRTAEMQVLLRIAETVRLDLDRSREDITLTATEARTQAGTLAELRRSQERLLQQHSAQLARAKTAEAQLALLRQQAEQHRHELAALRSSASWRITAPLRQFRATFRR